MQDIKWILDQRVECLDDCHSPVDEFHMKNLRSIYSAFPEWIDNTFNQVEDYHNPLIETKEQVEDAFKHVKDADEPAQVHITEQEQPIH